MGLNDLLLIIDGEEEEVRGVCRPGSLFSLSAGLGTRLDLACGQGRSRVPRLPCARLRDRTGPGLRELHVGPMSLQV